jgi:ribulose 1,5-bisphosphate synthetase/thiazole synthase
MPHQSLPVVVIGAGPVGLAAAAHLVSRRLTPLVLEAGDAVGAGIKRWSHVRMFSPWTFSVDPAAKAILERHGWSMPEGDDYPTGHDLVARYLEPLAGTTELAPHVRVNTRVVRVARQDHDLMKDGGRDETPFVVRVAGPHGEHDLLASAVILAVDEIIAATGFRPDWSILSEVRLDLDPSVQSPRALAPLIDPNITAAAPSRRMAPSNCSSPSATCS